MSERVRFEASKGDKVTGYRSDDSLLFEEPQPWGDHLSETEWKKCADGLHIYKQVSEDNSDKKIK